MTPEQERALLRASFVYRTGAAPRTPLTDEQREARAESVRRARKKNRRDRDVTRADD